MVFEVPDWKKSIDQNMFEVKIAGKAYKLPKFDYLTPRQGKQFSAADEDVEETYNLLDKLSVPNGLGSVLFDAPQKVTTDLMNAWTEDSGIDMGESKTSES